MRSFAKIVLLLLLLYACISSLLYPYWWYELLFEGKASDVAFWGFGVQYVVDSILFSAATISTVITVILILALSRTSLPDTLVSTGNKAWREYVLGPNFQKTVLLLLVLTVIGTSLSGVRSAQTRESETQTKKLLERSAELQIEIKNWNEKSFGKPPLSEPTTFLLLDKETVESLYGQFEPELVPYMVVEESGAGSEVNVGANIEDVIKAELGNKLFQKKVLEYKKTEKTPERKLRDLLRYFYERKSLKRYGAVELRSDDLKKLDDASQLLSRKYQLVLDTEKLRALRDRLLTQEMISLENDLKQLHGLVYVEGDWTVSNQGDFFELDRPFIPDVTNPPICQAKLRKSQLSAQNRDLMDDTVGKTLRMVIFGNVLTGITDKSRVVLVNPIAVF